MTLERQGTIKRQSPSTVEGILPVMFDYRVANVGFDIVKTIARNMDVVQLAIINIRKTRINLLNSVNLFIDCPKRVASDIKARNEMPSAIGLQHNIGKPICRVAI